MSSSTSDFEHLGCHFGRLPLHSCRVLALSLSTSVQTYVWTAFDWSRACHFALQTHPNPRSFLDINRHLVTPDAPVVGSYCPISLLSPSITTVLPDAPPLECLHCTTGAFIHSVLLPVKPNSVALPAVLIGVSWRKQSYVNFSFFSLEKISRLVNVILSPTVCIAAKAVIANIHSFGTGALPGYSRLQQLWVPPVVGEKSITQMVEFLVLRSQAFWYLISPSLADTLSYHMTSEPGTYMCILQVSQPSQRFSPATSLTFLSMLMRYPSKPTFLAKATSRRANQLENMTSSVQPAPYTMKVPKHFVRFCLQAKRQ